MSGSLLTRIPEESFSSLASLRIRDLMWLSVSESNIQAFDCSLVPLTLSCLDISHNEVPSLDSFTTLLVSCLDAGFSQILGRVADCDG